MPGEVIDTAYVEVVPTTNKFASKLRQDVDASFGRVNVSVKRAAKDMDREFHSAGVGAERSMKQVGSTGEREFRKVSRNARQAGGPLRQFAGFLRDIGVLMRTFIKPLAIGGLIAGLLHAASAAFALLAALSPVVGLIAALPGLFSAAAVGAGTVALAFIGIGAAVKALSEQQKNAGAQATGGAARQAAAAERSRAAQERVRSAVMSLERAREQAAESARNSSERIRDAEMRLEDTQRNVRQAQEELNDARREARQRLIDMRMEVERAALSEEDAAISVEEARLRLEEVFNDPRSTELERQRADLTYRTAQASLEEAEARKKATDAEAAAAKKGGVKSDPGVVSAVENLAEANKSAAEASRDLGLAQEEAKQAGVESSRAIAEAARDVALAQQAAGRAGAESGEKISSSLKKVNQAMADLSPAGQRFARFIFSLKPKLQELRATAQAGLLPGAESGIRSLMTLFPTVNAGIDGMAKSIGRFFANAGKRIALRKEDFALFNTSNVKIADSLGRATSNLIDGLIDLGVAAQPLTEWIARLTEKWSASFKATMEVNRANGATERFLLKTRQAAEKVFSIFGSLIGILKGLAKAAFVPGTDLLGGLDRQLDRLNKATNSKEGQANIRKFFDFIAHTGPKVAAYIKDIAKTFKDAKIESGDLQPVLNLTSVALKLIADNAGFVAGNLPLLISLFGAYKATQAAANVAALVGLPVQAARVASNFALAASLRAVAKSGEEATAAEVLGNTVRKQSLLLTLRDIAAKVGHKIATIASAAASKIAAAGQWLLNAAMTANPIGIVIAIIIALVAIIVVAYKKNETFRKIVQAAWAGIKHAVAAVVRWLVNTAWPFIKRVWDGIAAGARWLWRNVIVPAFNGIKRAVQLVFEGIRLVWNNVLKPVFNAIKTGVGLVVDGFKIAVRGIKTAWAGIREATKAPVKFVIETVLNKGIIKAWNWISDKILGGKLQIKPIALPRGFASGGIMPGYTPGRDNRLIAVGGGEAVMRPEWTRAVGPAAINAWNRAARTGGIGGVAAAMGIERFAGGGIIGKLKDLGASAWDKVSDVTSAVGDFLSDPIAFLKKQLSGPLNRLGEISATSFGKMLAQVPTTLADKIYTALKSVVFGQPAGGGVGGGAGVGTAGGMDQIKAFIRAMDPHPYVWGGVGPHGYDCSGLTGEVLARMRGLPSYHRYFTTSSNFGALGFQPGAGGTYSIGVNPGHHMAGEYGGLKFEARSTKSGIFVGPAAKSVGSFARKFHLARGGIIDKLLGLPIDIGGDPSGMTIGRGKVPTFDRGGILSPGLNLVQNSTGRAEHLTPTGSAVTIQTGAFQVVLNGPVDAATLPQVEEAMNRNFRELLRLIRVS